MKMSWWISDEGEFVENAPPGYTPTAQNLERLYEIYGIARNPTEDANTLRDGKSLSVYTASYYAYKSISITPHGIEFNERD